MDTNEKEKLIVYTIYNLTKTEDLFHPWQQVEQQLLEVV
jgi:hypothetical protein